MPAHLKPTPLRYCEYCGKKLERKRLPNGDLEYLFHFTRRKFCNQRCMGLAFDARPSKSSDWSTTHRHARKLVPKGPCAICGAEKARDVHHLDGDHTNNSPENLQRICRSCHSLGHREQRSCVICGLPHKGLGYCEKHYQRFKKWGDPTVVKDNQHAPCRSEG